jgi:hypothetical protein
MNARFQKIGISFAAFTLLASLTIAPAFGADKPQTFTGQVSDSMCGTKHMMADSAECTRACVKKGSKYALVVKDKVYTLDTSDAAAADKLDKLAGQQAKVTGAANGDTIAVSSVSPAK